MTKAEIFEKLKTLFVKLFGEEETAKITEATQASDVNGWDSFSHMTLLEDVEDSFSIQLSYRDIASLDSVGDLIDRIYEKTNR